MSGSPTHFKSGGGAGTGASDYLKDGFEDISVPASNNTGYTDSSSTNPLSEYFNNDDAPKFESKTLWIKDLVLIEDRSKWISNKPTYKVEFHESFPGAAAYCFGNCRLRNSSNGISVDISNIDDGFGVSGVIRRVAFIVNPSSETATADILVDGADSGSDITFGDASDDSLDHGLNKCNALLHASSDEDKDIHDYQITANQAGVMNVAGIKVYFENATTNIDLFPGSTYVDKDKKTTSSVTAQAAATPSGTLGAKTLIYKTASNTYTTSDIEPNNLNTVGTGTIDTNQITVTTGHGSSFPAGVGVVGEFGTSMYVGAVQSVSTDTLTVAPTLPVGVSGALRRAWWAGPTIAINASLYAQDFHFDPSVGVDANPDAGFAKSGTGDFYYSDPEKRYRIWGDQLEINQVQGYRGVEFNGATVGFLQVDGYFAAAEIEFAGAGILHGTFAINGAPAWGLNEGFTGVQKKTVFSEAGPGWNSFVFSVGESFGGAVVSRINFYNMQSDIGVSYGHLAEYDTLRDEVERTAINATLMTLGLHQRCYADELYLTGDWNRSATHVAAGGVRYVGASTNSVLKFAYYGTDFGLIGTAGASVIATLDGASINSSFNTMQNVATEDWHELVVTHKSGTSIIEAVDVVKARQEVKNLQNFLPREELDDSPGVYEQADTPRNPKNGTIWARNRYENDVWVYLFGRWNKFKLEEASDDPNFVTYIKSHGTTDSSDANAVATSKEFDFASWAALSDAPAARLLVGHGESRYKGKHHVVDGENTSGTPTLTHYQFNKTAWSTLTNRSTATSGFAQSEFNDLFIVAGGSTDGSNTNAQTTKNHWNGSSWSSGTAVSAAVNRPGGFTHGNGVELHVVGGANTASSLVTTHDIFNKADTKSSGTAINDNSRSHGNARIGGGGAKGFQATDDDNVYTWDGSSWASSAIAVSVQNSGGGSAQGAFNPVSGKAYLNGGLDASAAIANTQAFNDVSWVDLGKDSTDATSTGTASII